MMPHTLVWKNKGVQSRSFVPFALDNTNTKDDQASCTESRTKDAVPKNATKKVVTTTTAQEPLDCPANEKLLQEWAECYPSLVTCIAKHHGHGRLSITRPPAGVTTTKHAIVKKPSSKKVKTVAVLKHQESSGVSSVCTDQESSGDPKLVASNNNNNNNEGEAAWLARLEELLLLLKQDLLRHNGKAKLLLSDRSKELGQWLEDQRELARQGVLSPTRVQHLLGLGLPWCEYESVWKTNYQRLVANAEILFGSSTKRPILVDDRKLRDWVHVQIIQIENKELPSKRRKQMRALRRQLATQLDLSSKEKECKAYEMLCYREVCEEDMERTGGGVKRNGPPLPPMLLAKVKKKQRLSRLPSNNTQEKQTRLPIKKRGLAANGCVESIQKEQGKRGHSSNRPILCLEDDVDCPTTNLGAVQTVARGSVPLVNKNQGNGMGCTVVNWREDEEFAQKYLKEVGNLDWLW